MPVPRPENGDEETIVATRPPSVAEATAGCARSAIRARAQTRRITVTSIGEGPAGARPSGPREVPLLSLERAFLADSCEEALVDLALVDRHRLLVAEPDHLFALEVVLLGKLLRRQMVRHSSYPLSWVVRGNKKPTKRSRSVGLRVPLGSR